MLEGVLLQALAVALGTYVAGLEPSHLHVGLLSGRCVLENVSLRLEAFSGLDLPFALTGGTVGRLVVQLPRLLSLRSQPLAIAVEDVTITLGPHPVRGFFCP